MPDQVGTRTVFAAKQFVLVVPQAQRERQGLGKLDLVLQVQRAVLNHTVPARQFVVVEHLVAHLSAAGEQWPARGQQ